MSFGIEVYDSAGKVTLGMSDFTIKKLATFVIAKSKNVGSGVRSDYIVLDVPGYDPSNCFVIITPKVYASYVQPGYDDGWGYIPTYKDLGGTKIGICQYVNYKYFTGVYDIYKDQWMEACVESVVEVVRFS